MTLKLYIHPPTSDSCHYIQFSHCCCRHIAVFQGLQQNVFSALVMKLVGTLLRYGNYHRWPINMMTSPCILCSHFCIRRITVSWVSLLLHSARQELFDYCAWKSPAIHNVWSNRTRKILRRAGSNLSALLSTLNIWQHCHACRHRNTEKWTRHFWPIAAGY